MQDILELIEYRMKLEMIINTTLFIITLCFVLVLVVLIGTLIKKSIKENK
jgi:uncharacterized membrane protein required for colicin V production